MRNCVFSSVNVSNKSFKLNEIYSLSYVIYHKNFSFLRKPIQIRFEVSLTWLAKIKFLWQVLTLIRNTKFHLYWISRFGGGTWRGMDILVRPPHYTLILSPLCTGWIKNGPQRGFTAGFSLTLGQSRSSATDVVSCLQSWCKRATCLPRVVIAEG
jgi:hypothetical protein